MEVRFYNTRDISTSGSNSGLNVDYDELMRPPDSRADASSLEFRRKQAADCSEVELQLYKKTVELQTLTAQVNALNMEKQKKEEAMASLRTEHGKLVVGVPALQKKNHELESAFKIQEAMLETTETRNRALHEENTRLDNAILQKSRAQQELETLQTKILAARQVVTAAQSQLAEVRQEHTRLTTENANLVNGVRDHAAKIRAQEQSIADLQAQVQELCQNTQRVKEECTHLAATTPALQAEADAAEKVRSEKVGALHAIVTQLREADARLMLVRKQAEEIEAKNREPIKESDTQRNIDLQASIQAKLQQVKTLNTSISTLKEDEQQRAARRAHTHTRDHMWTWGGRGLLVAFTVIVILGTIVAIGSLSAISTAAATLGNVFFGADLAAATLAGYAILETGLVLLGGMLGLATGFGVSRVFPPSPLPLVMGDTEIPLPPVTSVTRMMQDMGTHTSQPLGTVVEPSVGKKASGTEFIDSVCNFFSSLLSNAQPVSQPLHPPQSQGGLSEGAHHSAAPT